MYKHILLILLHLIIYTPFLQAHAGKATWCDRYNFTFLTMDEGLPNNFVDDIIKDSRGFLWIATPGSGVARYDGYDFVSFDMATPCAPLRSNFVRSICEDHFGRIWTASELGVDVINIYTLQKEELNHSDDAFDSLCNRSVQQVFCDNKGNLWFCSGNHLFKVQLDAAGNLLSTTDVATLNDDGEIFAICQVDDYLWFNRGSDVVRIKIDDAKAQEPVLVSLALRFPQGTRIGDFHQKSNEMWIATSMGLFRYNINDEAIKLYQHNPADETSLSQNFVTYLAETDDHILLVATLKGLNIYNPTTDSFERIIKDADQSCGIQRTVNSLNCDFLNCMLSDGDIVWIGTEIGGLNKASRRSLFVDNYVHSPVIPTSISENPVNAIYEDANGTLWVGTVEGGLSRKSADSSFFSHYTTSAPSFLSHNSVSCFTADNQNRLWMGTWGGGIGWVDQSNPSDKRFHHIYAEEYPDLSWGFVGAICYDELNQAIWVVTAINIYVYDLKSGLVSEPFKDLKMGGLEGTVGSCISKDNHLWLGLTNGLCRIDLRTLKSPRLVYQLWRNKLDKPDSKLKERVTYISQAEDGTMWVGSNGYGVYYSTLDEDNEFAFHALRTEDGLIDNCVRGVIEDNEGRIWISTVNGVSCYYPDNKLFTNYNRKDGLISNQYYWNAIHKGRDGDVYLGSLAGLSVIKSATLHQKVGQIPISFTHIKVANEEVHPVDGVLNMHERDKSLNLDFVALDYLNSDYANYSYRLRGFDDEWIKVPANRRNATFTNLKAGTYTFELCYAPDGKHWVEQTETLTIKVKPYFYKTYWFIISVSLLLLLLGYKTFAWRINSLKQQKEHLNQKVVERTQELEIQKKQLTVQAEELSQQNELLKQQNEKITKQKEQLLKMSKKVQALTIDKLAFFTNITHEFRTPLTLIIGPIERALKLSYNPQVIEQLNYVERNSKYLLSLVNQLMDFRKVESGKMEIVCTPNNLNTFFDEVTLPFKAYAQERGIDIQTHYRLPQSQVMCDDNALRKVVINLIGNALKFTPKGGVISIIVSTVHYQGKPQLFLCVKDTGTGIPEQDLDKVFNRFYQSSNNKEEAVSGQSGTGIGLYLCRRIVQLHNGDIKVKNNVQGGCSFRIILPLQFVSSQPIEEAKWSDDSGGNVDKQPELSNKMTTVLVVEDNKDMRSYIKSVLKEYYDVVEASQGEEAMRVLTTRPIDFIVSDLMMPVMDGMELSKRVKADFSLSHIPFLMLTAKTSEESRIEGFRQGVDEYLMKPFDEDLLLTRIRNIIDNRKRLQQKFSISMDVDALNIEMDSGDKKFIDKAMQIVKDNFQNSHWEVSDFIEEMGVSKSLLNKKMQSLTGQSAGQFMRNYRLSIAHELIQRNAKTKSLNISEIAYEVGFNDPKYFTRCFTKHFGVTPSSLIN